MGILCTKKESKKESKKNIKSTTKFKRPPPIIIPDFKYKYPSKREMERIVKRSYGEKSLPIGPLFNTKDKYMKELKFRFRRADM